MDNHKKDNDKINSDISSESQNNAHSVEGSVRSGEVAGVKTDEKNTAAANQQPDLSLKNWESGLGKRPWSDDPTKRLAIRTFSRGVMGAAFFTLGGTYARRDWGLSGYTWNPTRKVLLEGAERTTWKDLLPTRERKSIAPLKIIAKAIDSTATPLIEGATYLLSGGNVDKAERAVRFRRTVSKFSTSNYGRSLGEEVVGITFDFFSASIGDALGRDIASWFDPAIKKDWMGENGHIKAPEALRSMGRSLFRYVTYNGGEDWAVAIPYAYYMRGQRKLINRFSPGFILDAERGLNGGSLKVNEHGDVVGNYNVEGMLDLQSRFTAYNVGTLMYREAYNYVGHKLRGEDAVLYGGLDAERKGDKTLGDKIANAAKWVVRSAVKGVIVMTPAVPFFSITRTPQSKYKGTFINPDTQGILCYHPEGNVNLSPDVVHANERTRHHDYGKQFGKASGVFFNKFDYDLQKWEKGPGQSVEARVRLNPLRGKKFDAYNKTFGIVDHVINVPGNLSDTVRKSLHHVPDKLLGVKWDSDRKGGFFASDNVNTFRAYKKLSDRFWNASVSYTPYMIAKGETALLWDNGKMDMSLERAIDGATSLNWSEFRKGVGETWDSFWHRPLADPEREAQGQKRIAEDQSAPDVFTYTKKQLLREKRNVKHWENRIIRKNNSDEAEHADTDSYIKKLVEAGGQQRDIPSRPQSYQEQEALRRLLEESEPLTPSRH